MSQHLTTYAEIKKAIRLKTTKPYVWIAGNYIELRKDGVLRSIAKSEQMGETKPRDYDGDESSVVLHDDGMLIFSNAI